nr:hypothetical protein GCM10020185_77830 [Pseudomonas brassicacearum subsp. brassicacearum]
MGVYRLLLAMLVAVSHMGMTFMGFNPGVVAVVSFLIISGFVMTSLIERTYNTPGQIGLFYMDRLLRLYPQFLVYFVLSCAVIHFLLPGTPQAAALTLENIATSLPIVPLGFYMFGITVPEILPPAWSLGLEMCFYLLIPFLILYKTRGIAFALSVTVFMVASLGYLDTDIYGYRLLPGVLFIFPLRQLPVSGPGQGAVDRVRYRIRCSIDVSRHCCGDHSASAVQRRGDPGHCPGPASGVSAQ